MTLLTVEESTPEYIKFMLSETTVSYANALRRILISEVPTVAIDLVEIERNNTVLPDEVLAHRLGLIPIYSKRDLRYKDECGCADFCPECAAVFDIDVIHSEDMPRTVSTRELVCSSSDFSIKNGPVIVKLAKDQGLKARCIARKGIGRTHSKWSPVSAIRFEYDPQNAARETNYWFEESVEQEWPGVRQTEPSLLEKISTIHMCVEVVEGGASPLAVVLRALHILRDKVAGLLASIETG